MSEQRMTKKCDADLTVRERPILFSAPMVRALARQYASECATCSGTGLVTIHDTYMGDADDQPCHDCADIRSAIARATNGEAAQ